MLRFPVSAVLVILFCLPGCATGDGQINAAERAFNRGDFSEVLKYSTLALGTPDLETSDRARAYEARGLVHLSANEDALALSDLDLAAQLAPDRRDYVLMRGVGYRRTGQYEKAIQDYEALLQKMPRDDAGFRAYRNRAAMYLDMGEPEKAVTEYTSWIARNRSIHWGEPSEAYWGRCFARAVLGQLQEAMTDCEASVHYSHYLTAAGPMDVKGYIHLKLGQYREAVEDFDRALAGPWKFPTSFYGRGLARREMGDGIGSETDMEVAKKLDPKVADYFDTFRPSLEFWMLPRLPHNVSSGCCNFP